MTDDEIVEGCEISKKFNVATACIKPYCIPMVMELLSGSDVGVCSVIAFPHGNSTIAVKVRETKEALLAGACRDRYGCKYRESKRGRMGLRI